MASKIKTKLLDPPYENQVPDGIRFIPCQTWPTGEVDPSTGETFTLTRFREMITVVYPLFESVPGMLNNNDRRCLTLCEALSDYIVDPIIEAKSKKISVKLREEGNAYFKSNKLDKALERYTMSICFAPAGSLELAMAYANRSAVLFKAKWMFDCLVDIDRALQLGYPDNLKAKLFLRKASCHQALNPRKREPIGEAFAEARRWLEKVDKKNQASLKKMLDEQEALKPTEERICNRFDADLAPPKLKAENSSIPGLSDAVEMQYSQKIGRYLVAARDIKPGEVIGVQKPYINCLALTMRYRFCWHCGKQVWSSIPCDGCSQVVYCSTKCRDNAHQEYHDVECWVFPRIIVYGVASDIVAALRLTIKALKEFNNDTQILYEKINEINKQGPKEKGFINGKFEATKYASTCSLDKDIRYTYDKATVVLIQSLLIAFFLTKKMKLSPLWQFDINHLKNDPSFINFFRFVEHNGRIKLHNDISVVIPIPGGEQEIQKISTAIIPYFSFLKHSCLPITFHNTQSENVVLSSLVPIKKGEQIFSNHGAGILTHHKSTRTALLLSNGINCKCKACINNWPSIFELFNPIEFASIDLEFRCVTDKCSLINKLIFSYARQNNKIMDLKEEQAVAAKLVEKVYRNSAENSLKALMATCFLRGYITFSQRPFLFLK